jgi:rhodanese-related sulfurtransferase
MRVLAKLFGTDTASVDAVEARELQRAGAVIVDVRETSEWDAGTRRPSTRSAEQRTRERRRVGQR